MAGGAGAFLTFCVFGREQDIQLAIVVRMSQRVENRADFFLLNLSRFAGVEHTERSSQHFGRLKRGTRIKNRPNCSTGSL